MQKLYKMEPIRKKSPRLGDKLEKFIHESRLRSHHTPVPLPNLRHSSVPPADHTIEIVPIPKKSKKRTKKRSPKRLFAVQRENIATIYNSLPQLTPTITRTKERFLEPSSEKSLRLPEESIKRHRKWGSNGGTIYSPYKSQANFLEKTTSYGKMSDHLLAKWDITKLHQNEKTCVAAKHKMSQFQKGDIGGTPEKRLQEWELVSEIRKVNENINKVIRGIIQ